MLVSVKRVDIVPLTIFKESGDPKHDTRCLIASIRVLVQNVFLNTSHFVYFINLSKSLLKILQENYIHRIKKPSRQKLSNVST